MKRIGIEGWSIGSWFMGLVIVAAAGSANAAGPASGINVNVVNNPLPVAGVVTGTVNVDPIPTATLLQRVGLPMNFQTTEPLDTSTCEALRVVLKSPTSGPSLLFRLVDSEISTDYFSKVFPSGQSSSEVVDLPAPTTNVAMGISGDCPGCALAIYCR
jgi:hypothetical protein